MIRYDMMMDSINRYEEDIDLLLEALEISNKEKKHRKGHEENIDLSGAKGTLVVNGDGEDCTFSLQTKDKEGKRKTVLMGDKNSPRVRAFVENLIEKQLKSDLKKRKEEILKVRKLLENSGELDIYSKMASTYKKITSRKKISEHINSLLAKIESLDISERKRNPIRIVGPANIARNGESVRSKGEAIIYNMLYDAGLSFYVDRELKLHDEEGRSVIKYPDFTIALGNRLVYWEHLGRMDDKEYEEDFYRRVRLYWQNNICLGENLIVTCDRANHSFNSFTAGRIVDLLRSE